jgi:glycosyltransferase involved in cell wall biosynthesis
LKILFVSWYFPPVNTIGALRTGKFARFLIERGHDLGVVSGKYWGQPETLPLGVPLERVVYAKSIDVNTLPGEVRRILKRRPAPIGGAAPAVAPNAPGSKDASLLHRLGEFYIDLTNFPDNRIGWLPWAYAAGRRITRNWQPDLVFASGPPFTALIAARALASRLGVPWVAELRDRWADDPYIVAPRWRMALDHWQERRVLKSARGLVTVTEPWAEFYRTKYGKPLVTVFNGYDPLDFADPVPEPAPGPPLVIGYTGGIYPGRRDPTPLFEAVRLLGAEGEQIRMVFCGTDPALVLPLAERVGVAHLVEVRPSIPYQQSLAFQRQSDVLLLMQWNDPKEQGNCPGKFFEYIASLRPMLILGLADGVPATIAKERGAGLCINEPPRIAEQLRFWLRQKQNSGRVPGLPEAARDGLSRTIQYEKLEQFLLTMVR